MTSQRYAPNICDDRVICNVHKYKQTSRNCYAILLYIPWIYDKKGTLQSTIQDLPTLGSCSAWQSRCNVVLAARHCTVRRRGELQPHNWHVRALIVVQWRLSHIHKFFSKSCCGVTLMGISWSILLLSTLNSILELLSFLNICTRQLHPSFHFLNRACLAKLAWKDSLRAFTFLPQRKLC